MSTGPSGAVRSILVTPMSPRLAGNGLAQRCAMWHEVLSGLGSLTTVVAPVAGPVAPGSDEVELTPAAGTDPTLPRLAQGLTDERGRRLARELGDLADGVDLVVAVRSYTALVGVGLSEALGARVVADLDDDDVAYFSSVGASAEAARYRQLVDIVRRRSDLVTSAAGFDGTHPVPNSVRVPPEAPATSVGTGAQRVVLMGNMGYEPNAAGAVWLIESILPLVREQLPDVEVDIVGPGSEQYVPFGRGYVADLALVLAGAGVVVAPLHHGSGTRTKILDAWAHGRAVVSTTVGADGLDATDGVHLLLADDEASFAAAVVRVLRDPTLAAALGSAGRALVTAHFCRPTVVADARDLLCGLIAADAAAGCNTSVDERSQRSR